MPIQMQLASTIKINEESHAKWYQRLHYIKLQIML